MSGGSLQLRMFRNAIRDGKSLNFAASIAGMSLTEAKLTLEADAADPPPPPDAYDLIGSTRKDSDMARTAKKDDEVELIKTPDFKRAIKVITNDVEPQDERNAKARGEMSAAWKIVEDECHVNKAAAKDFRKIRNMSDELRDDYLRSLYGLMSEDGIGISSDLVDAMGDSDAPSMPVTKRRPVELATLSSVN
jgi:hypothetical protein